MELGQMINVEGKSKEEKSEIVCTKDTTTCPDGSVVGRNPDDNCEFYACPPARINEIEVKKGILGLDYKQVIAITAAAIIIYFVVKK